LFWILVVCLLRFGEIATKRKGAKRKEKEKKRDDFLGLFKSMQGNNIFGGFECQGKGNIDDFEGVLI
jgi:hypothetical protein